MGSRSAAALGFLTFLTVCVPAWAQTSDYDCLLKPSTETSVSTRELGVIAEFLVDRGDSVEAGQPLARLESGVEEATVELMRSRALMDGSVEEAKLEFDYANRRLQRIESLADRKVATFDEQDMAQTEARKAELRLRQVRHQQSVLKLELKQAERRLALRTIRSPIDGVIVARLLNVGESAEDRPIISLAELDPLSVEVIVPAVNFGSINVGDDAIVAPRIGSTGPLDAKVVVVDRLVDAASNTFGVRLELPNPENAVPGGVRCDISFDSASAVATFIDIDNASKNEGIDATSKNSEQDLLDAKQQIAETERQISEAERQLAEH